MNLTDTEIKELVIDNVSSVVDLHKRLKSQLNIVEKLLGFIETQSKQITNLQDQVDVLARRKNRYY